MKKAQTFLATLVILMLGSASLHAESSIPRGKYFELEKELQTEPYITKDFIEFSLFDMKGVEVSVYDQVDGQLIENTEARQRLNELIIKTLPRVYYQSLRDAIIKKKIPVTLYPAESPAYANAIRLSVKVKKVSITPLKNRKGAGSELFLRIYGHIRDKKSGKILLKFYDSGYAAGDESLWENSLRQVANKNMTNLTRYLKNKY